MWGCHKKNNKQESLLQKQLQQEIYDKTAVNTKTMLRLSSSPHFMFYVSTESTLTICKHTSHTFSVHVEHFQVNYPLKVQQFVCNSYISPFNVDEKQIASNMMFISPVIAMTCKLMYTLFCDTNFALINLWFSPTSL